MSYDPAVKVYYCKQSESPTDSHKITPAPSITINPEIYYANDNVIGYTYNITLSGYANALRKDLDPDSTAYGLSDTISHIGFIREIFNTNGGNLYIKQSGSNILVAKGATVKSLEFNNSDNKWFNYAPFTVEIEFNEIDFIGCSNNSPINCNNSIFHQIANTKNISDNLVDIKKYKIKEFKDKWSFTIDNQIYENCNGSFNNVFKVSYDLSATGKNYYINDNLVPAWQQARLFVQDKLYKQVTSLISGQNQIETNNDDACEASKDLSSIHNMDNLTPRQSGLFKDFKTLRDAYFNDIRYDIYNEKITCNTSESDGTFSVVYECMIKKYDNTISPSANSVLHTYTKTNTIDTSKGVNPSISVQGTIQGLVRGGFIYYNNDYILPASGTFLTSIDSKETKYANALGYFNAKVGDASDLSDSFKDILNIKKSELLIPGVFTGDSIYPRPSSFSVDHAYSAGTITYNGSYDKNLATTLDNGYTNITITRNDPIDIVQEFVVPGRSNGPIIQKLNMKTSRIISVNIEGADYRNRGCTIADPCDSLPFFKIKDFEALLSENNSWLKIKEDYSVNKIDGSFSINLEYMIRSC